MLNKISFLVFLFMQITLAQPILLTLMSDDAAVFNPITDLTSVTLEFLVTGDMGITASTWTDQSGNSRDMTFTNTPTLGTKGDCSTVILNGTDEYGRLDAFTLEQPITVIIVLKTITFTDGRRLFDGNTGNSMGLFYTDPSALAMYSGASLGGLASPYTTDSWDMHYCVFNGASSYYQKNSDTAIEGNAGTSDGGGFNLGSFNLTTLPSNIEVIAIAILSGVPNETDKTNLQTYFAGYRDK